MAKSLNLTDSSITSLYVHTIGGGDASVRYHGNIYDDQGNLVREADVTAQFSDLPASIKAALNIVMRMLSKEFNNDQVNENKETWTDK